MKVAKNYRFSEVTLSNIQVIKKEMLEKFGVNMSDTQVIESCLEKHKQLLMSNSDEGAR